jgi:hypothetical protein
MILDSDTGKQVGRVGECYAKDPATELLRLQSGKEESVLVHVNDDYHGVSIELVVQDGSGIGVRLGSKKLINKGL